jgi:UDP-N-acetylglucosamine--dolichyl-phosphate N-acetylglucosaminephosphotransferase
MLSYCLIGFILFVIYNILQRIWIKLNIQHSGIDFHKKFQTKSILRGGFLVPVLYIIYLLVLSNPLAFPLAILNLLFLVFGYLDESSWKGIFPQKIKFILPFFLAIIPALLFEKNYLWLLLFTIKLPPIVYSFIMALGILGSSQAFNQFAGYDGFNPLMAVSIILMLTIIKPTIVPLSIPLVFLILGFYFYNKYPSRCFPGDSFTYTVGATIGYLTCVAGVEILCFVFYLLYFIEFFIKLLNFLNVESFTFHLKEGFLFEGFKTSLFQYFISKGFKTERAVVFIIIFLQVILCLVTILIVSILN